MSCLWCLSFWLVYSVCPSGEVWRQSSWRGVDVSGWGACPQTVQVVERHGALAIHHPLSATTRHSRESEDERRKALGGVLANGSLADNTLAEQKQCAGDDSRCTSRVTRRGGEAAWFVRTLAPTNTPTHTSAAVDESGCVL